MYNLEAYQSIIAAQKHQRDSIKVAEADVEEAQKALEAAQKALDIEKESLSLLEKVGRRASPNSADRIVATKEDYPDGVYRPARKTVADVARENAKTGGVVYIEVPRADLRDVKKFIEKQEVDRVTEEEFKKKLDEE